MGISLVLALLVLGLGVAVVRAGAATALVEAVGRVLGSDAGERAGPEPRLQAATYAAALAAARAEPGAFSLAGARALLAEELGPELGERVLSGVLEAEARRRAPMWFAAFERHVPGNRLVTGATIRAGEAEGVSVHVVTPHEEAVAGAPGPRGGWQAALRSLAFDGLAEVASRIHVVGGVSTDVASLMLDAEEAGDGVQQTVRAGDVILCRPYAVRVQLDDRPERVAFIGTRLLVLRGGAVVGETAVAHGRCD